MTEDSLPPGRPRKPRYKVRVRRVRRLTPRIVRVSFGGEELAGFAWSGPAAHIKLIFDSGSETARPVTRTYTPRRFDRQALELDVDFVIHGEGPASAWAAQAAEGQTLQVAGPGRSYALDNSADWFVLAGDDTAIPAIATILEALPPKAVAKVYLEVVDLADMAALDAVTTAAQIHGLPRGPDSSRAGQELEAALRQMDLPAGSGRVYVACESGAMRRIRRHLLQERGLAPSQLVTRGYWKLGATDHPDRDYGEDAPILT